MKKQKAALATKEVSARSNPTTYELTQIAATISKNDQFGNSPSSEIVVEQALRLWSAACELLEHERANPEKVRPRATAPEGGPLPEPKSYPVMLVDFLELMLPGMSSEDKESVFRKHIESLLKHPRGPAEVLPLTDRRPSTDFFQCCDPRILPLSVLSRGNVQVAIPNPTQADVNHWIILWSTDGIPNAESYQYHARSFRDFYEPLSRAKKSSSKSDNACTRYAKAKLRKSLWKKSSKELRRGGLEKFRKPTIEEWEAVKALNHSKPISDYKNWNYDIHANSSKGV